MLARRASTNNAAAPFSVNIASDCPADHTIQFTVTVEHAGFATTKGFVIGIGGLCNPDDSYQYVLVTSQAIKDATEAYDSVKALPKEGEAPPLALPAPPEVAIRNRELYADKLPAWNASRQSKPGRTEPSEQFRFSQQVERIG